MEPEYISRLITASLTGDLTPEEEAELRTWREQDPANEAEFEAYRKVWELSENYETDYQPDVKANLARFEAALDEKEGGKVITLDPTQANGQDAQTASTQSGGFPLMRVAAVVVLGVLAAVAYFLVGGSNTVTVATVAGEEKEVVLPDGSTIFLNQSTSITYDQDFATRDIELNGEAFFEVERDTERPFRVNAKGTVTTVLGTSFEVRAYNNQQAVEVTVESGKVKFATPGDQSALLEADQSARFDESSGKLNPNHDTGPNALAWKRNALNWGVTTFGEVIADSEEYFNVTIKVKNTALESCTYQIPLMKDPTLEQVFEILNSEGAFEIEQRGNVYEIDGDHCPE